MTIKHKSNMSFDPVYLAKLENGKEPLPTGITKTSNGYGYRISRTFKGTDYRFGTFQSLEHALRTNEYINRFIDAVHEELEKRPATVEDVERIVGRRMNDVISCIGSQNFVNKERFDTLEERFNEKQSLWKRLFNK